MIIAVFSACSDKVDPEKSGTSSTNGSSSSSTPGSSTSETTDAGFDGYEFVLCNIDNEWTETPQNSLEEELVAIYDDLSQTYNIKFSFSTIENENEDILTAAVAGDKIADFIKVRQMAWAPAAVKNALRPLNSTEVIEAGLNVSDDEVCEQVYTNLSNLHDDKIWGCAFGGKFFIPNIGFTYVFNKELLASHGYTAESVYNDVYNYNWSW